MEQLRADKVAIPMANLREDVMTFSAATRPIDHAKMEGQWLLIEGEEDPEINRVVELRDGSIFRNREIVGRYLVFERHVELWQDDAPLIMFWGCSDDLLVGAQDYLFGEEEPYRVKMLLDRVKDGRARGVEPTLALALA